MQNIYWLFGSPCAGKTTIADILAQEYNLRVYHLDRYNESFYRRADPNQHPHLTYAKSVGLDFLTLPTDEQIAHIKGISAENFEFVLDDIAEWQEENPDTPILVEGANLRADDIASHISDPHQAICLIPTEEFQLATYPKRGTWVQDVLSRFPEAQRLDIFDNWMQRDTRHAEWIAQSADEQNIRTIIVDGTATLLDNAVLVAQHFGLPTND